MIFRKKYNFAFQHVPRAGGTTVRLVLQMLVGHSDEGSFRLDHVGMEEALDTIRDEHPKVSIDNIPLYINVRNSFDRIASLHYFRRQSKDYDGKSFEEFFYDVFMTSDGFEKPQEFFCCYKGKLPNNARVIRFEGMGSAWVKVIKQHFKIKLHYWPRMNYSTYPKDAFFTDDMKRLVIEKEKWVIENFYPELLK